MTKNEAIDYFKILCIYFDESFEDFKNIKEYSRRMMSEYNMSSEEILDIVREVKK